MRSAWPPFVTAAVEARGFLKDEGIRQEFERTVTEMKSQAQDSLNHVREESQKTLAEAKKLAQDIEERACRTAAHISVEAAQQQFKEAQLALNKNVKQWGWMSGIAIAAFVGIAIYLAKIHLPEGMKWELCISEQSGSLFSRG